MKRFDSCQRRVFTWRLFAVGRRKTKPPSLPFVFFFFINSFFLFSDVWKLTLLVREPLGRDHVLLRPRPPNPPTQRDTPTQRIRSTYYFCVIAALLVVVPFRFSEATKVGKSDSSSIVLQFHPDGSADTNRVFDGNCSVSFNRDPRRETTSTTLTVGLCEECLSRD